VAQLQQTIKQLDADIRRTRLAQPPDGAVAENGDRAGMIALNMALNGASRDETERYLEQSFSLPNPEHIVDAAYEQVRRLRGA
jgi:hypothetical protein